MANKLKPNEMRNVLLASGNVKPDVEAFTGTARFKDPKASMQAAIAARRKECKVIPVPEEKKVCFRCVTPKMCAIYGCVPNTFPKEKKNESS